MYLYHMYNKKRRILLYNRLFLNKHADICVLFARWLLSKESSFVPSLCSFVVSFFLNTKNTQKVERHCFYVVVRQCFFIVQFFHSNFCQKYEPIFVCLLP